MPTKVPSMFRGLAGGESNYLYLIGGVDGSIKVGRTGDPESRIRTRRIAMGENFGWVHLFRQSTSGQCEYGVKKELEQVGQRLRKTEKYFGISKTAALAVCRFHIEEHLCNRLKWAEDALRKRVQDAAWDAFRNRCVETA